MADRSEHRPVRSEEAPDAMGSKNCRQCVHQPRKSVGSGGLEALVAMVPEIMEKVNFEKSGDSGKCCCDEKKED